MAGGNNWTALYAKKGSASKAGVFDGNVTIIDSLGIGRTNPAFRLDVYGDGRFGNNTRNVIVGTYSYYCHTQSIGTAIYSPNGSLFLGIPTNWAYATYSSNIFYNYFWKFSSNTNILPCDMTISAPISDIDIWQTASLPSRDSISEQVEYVFNPIELQAVFPSLVSVHDTCDGGEPQYAINYVGMVPILTSAIKEQHALFEVQRETINQLQLVINQQQQINEQQQQAISQQQTEIVTLQMIAFHQSIDLVELRDRVDNCCNLKRDSSYFVLDSNNNAILYQSKPSPFSTNTDISCYVPVIADSAFVYVYNLQGIQVKSFPIIQGQNIVTISASELPAGMYLYTLVVDDVIIDTKRLILTK